MATPVRAFPWARLMLGVELALVIGCAAAGPWSAWIAAAFVIGIVAIVTLGIFFAQLGLFARPIVRADDAGDRLALTFDDGPDASSTRAVLDLLDARGQKATFFVIGRHAEAQRELVADMVRRGHLVANHSYEHRHTTPFMAPAALAAELAKAEQLIGSFGESGRWFRAPVGIVSPRVAQAAERAGLTLVSWTRSARDGTKRATVERALNRLRGALQPGAILVLHDGAERGDRTPIAPALLSRVLDEMAARGLRSVTLDELFDS